MIRVGNHGTLDERVRRVEQALNWAEQVIAVPVVGSELETGSDTGAPHNLLSATHGDTSAASVARGALIVGNSTPAWARLTVGTANYVLGSDGTDVTWHANTGTGSVVRATSPTLVTPALGTPTSGTLTSCTGLPISTGVAGLGTGVATFLATPSSANLRSAVTDETGTGALVFATSPTLVTPVLGTPTSGTLTNCTGLPLTTGITGTLGVANGGTGFASYADGDLLIATGVTTLTAVAKGTSGDVLTAKAASPYVEWKAPGGSSKWTESSGDNSLTPNTAGRRLALGDTYVVPGQAISIASAGTDGARIEVTNAGATIAGQIRLGKARGASVGAETAAQSGDRLGTFSARGYGATGWPTNSTGSLVFFAGENFTDAAMGTYATVYTTPTGSVTAAERLRVAADGAVGLGVTPAAVATARLDVTGKIRTDNAFVSTLATGTKPLDVTSTTVCTNLNADKLDGVDMPTLAQGDLLYGSAASTLSVLAKNTSATRYLANTGTSNNPAWAQIDLTNGVTGALPIANGGTGQTAKTSAFDALAPTTTKGDFIAYDGTDNVRVAQYVGGNCVLFGDGTGTTVPSFVPTSLVSLSLFSDPGTWFTLNGVSGGQTAIGGTASGDDLTLQSTAHATRGQIVLTDELQLRSSLTSLGAATETAMSWAPTLSLTSDAANPVVLSVGGTWTTTNTTAFFFGPGHVVDFAPTLTNSGASWGSVPAINGVFGFRYRPTITATVANTWYSGATYPTFLFLPVVTKSGSGSFAVCTLSGFTVSANLGAGITAGNLYGYNYAAPVLGAGASVTTHTVLNVDALPGTTAYAVKTGIFSATTSIGMDLAAYSGTTSIALRCAAFTGATSIGLDVGAFTGATLSAAVRSAITADAVRYFLYDTGGAQSYLTGKFTTYNAVATAGFGLPTIVDADNYTGRDTNIGSTNLASTSTSGRYRVSYYLSCTTAATGTGNMTATIAWNDGVARTSTSATVALTSTANFTQGTLFVTNTSGSISYSTTNSGTYSTAKYTFHAVAERIE